jgi:hypothetical protein
MTTAIQPLETLPEERSRGNVGLLDRIAGEVESRGRSIGLAAHPARVVPGAAVQRDDRPVVIEVAEVRPAVVGPQKDGLVRCRSPKDSIVSKAQEHGQMNGYSASSMMGSIPKKSFNTDSAVQKAPSTQA